MSWGKQGRPSEALRTFIEEQSQRFPVLPILQAGLHRIVPCLSVLRALPFLPNMPGVAQLIAACLERVYTSAGPPVGDQASDQP